MIKPDPSVVFPHFTAHSQAGAPYYDEVVSAWVFSRYADVMSVFRCPNLVLSGLKNKPSNTASDRSKSHSTRVATQRALSRVQLRVWRERFEPEVQALANRLPDGQPVDLLAGFAQPLCLTLASMVTDVSLDEASRLRVLAEPLRASAAEPYDPALKKQAAAASTVLHSCFHSGPEPLRDSAFVALTHTLPCLLGNVWLALLQNRQQWNVLHRSPGLLRIGLQELLRYAELPRILFRRAAADLEVSGVRMQKGDLVVLNIMAANRDPDRFVDAEHVDVQRRHVRPLTLGAGPNSCVGANLIRLATITMTHPLIERFPNAALDRSVEFKGGSGFRFPASLWVTFTASSV
jgi:cytochrome P450